MISSRRYCSIRTTQAALLRLKPVDHQRSVCRLLAISAVASCLPTRPKLLGTAKRLRLRGQVAPSLTLNNRTTPLPQVSFGRRFLLACREPMTGERRVRLCAVACQVYRWGREGRATKDRGSKARCIDEVSSG